MMKKLLTLLIFAAVASAQWQGRKPMLGEQIDWSHPLSNGLVGCWLMNEGGGNKVYDLSGNGNTGTFVNTPTWLGGPDGPMIDFTKADEDYINCGDNCQEAGSTEYTMIVKYRFDTLPTGGSNQAHMIGRWGGIATKNTISARLVNSTTARLLLSDADYDDVTISALSTGVWYIMAWVYNAGAGAFYLDGTSKGSFSGLATVIPTPSTAVDFTLVADIVPWGESDGQMSYAMAYTRALTPGEIAHLYREPFCFMVKDDIGITYTAAIPAAAPTGQVIIILSTLPAWLILGLSLALIRTRREKD